MNWNVQIMPLRVADAGGNLSDAAVAAAFAYAGQMGAKVVNASLGGAYTSTAELAAINGAPNTLFVVSAGNSNLNIKSSAISPCTLPAANILCVGATGPTDTRASFSNYAPTQVDIAAPGVNILSTLPGDQFGYYNGTSMASPHVAGVAALVFAAYPTRSVAAVDRGDPERRRPQVRPHDLIRERPPPERRRCARRRGDPAARPDARQPERAHVGRRGAERDREPARPRRDLALQLGHDVGLRLPHVAGPRRRPPRPTFPWRRR